MPTTHERASLGQRGVQRIVSLFREDQPTDFIALEFLVSPEIRRNLDRKTKFYRIFAAAEASFPENGFAWQEMPGSMKFLVEILRQEIASLDDNKACELLNTFLTDPDPPLLKKLAA